MIGELTRDIERALDAELWTVALAASLALPDICGALASDDGEARGSRYREWFEENLSDRYRWLLPEDVYKLRCSMLHQGRSRAKQYTRIVFTIPGPVTAHNNLMHDVLNLDIRAFSLDLAAAARAWYVAHFNDTNVARNRQSMMKWHEDGLAPYFTGVPVLT